MATHYMQDRPRIFIYSAADSPSVIGIVEALAEDGVLLGEEVTLNEGFALGAFGYRRHKLRFWDHYPRGYVLEFVSFYSKPRHAPLQLALRGGKRTKRNRRGRGC